MLIILDSFILVRGSKVLLGTIMWIGGKVVFYQCHWVGDVFLMELYMKNFLIIYGEKRGNFSIFGFSRRWWSGGNYLISKWVIVTG